MKEHIRTNCKKYDSGLKLIRIFTIKILIIAIISCNKIYIPLIL